MAEIELVDSLKNKARVRVENNNRKSEEVIEDSEPEGLSYADKRDVEFTSDRGVTSTYHVWAKHVDITKPVGALFWFHGDDAWEYRNPDSDVYIGGDNGILAQAKKRNMIFVLPLSPDRVGPITWWEDWRINPAYVWSLYDYILEEYKINKNNVWTAGFSGGAEFVSYHFIPWVLKDTGIRGGGAVMFSGGGSPESFEDSVKQDERTGEIYPLTWIVGENDTLENSVENFDAKATATKAYNWYTGQGWDTKFEIVPGKEHLLNRLYGGYLDKTMDRQLKGEDLTYADDRDVEFTSDRGVTSTYHIWAEHVDITKPVGALLWFHGDDAWEYRNPDSDVYIGGENGILAQAKKRNMIFVLPLSPDRVGPITWWEDWRINPAYVGSLYDYVLEEYKINKDNVWTAGFSGGAEFISYHFIPWVLKDTGIRGGGSVMFSGGGSPESFEDSVRQDERTGEVYPLSWIVGENDTLENSDENFDARATATKAYNWYTGQGWDTKFEIVPDKEHLLNRLYGGYLDEAMKRE